MSVTTVRFAGCLSCLAAVVPPGQGLPLGSRGSRIVPAKHARYSCDMTQFLPYRTIADNCFFRRERMC